MTHGVGFLLLAAVAGYWVLERASSHKGNLKRVGQLVGAAVILISLLGAICKIACAATCPPDMMGTWGKGGFCPFSSPPASTTPTSQ